MLIVGLGNPGAKYAGNRHNIGFMALDQIADDHGFGPWKSKFQGVISQGQIDGQKLTLLKPETFMNNSGQSVGEAARYFKVEPNETIVFHDEIDLAPGKCRYKLGGGHAGHNGLRSLHQHIGPDYARVRLGVGHPGRKEMVPHYVLSDFAKADQDWLDDLIRGVSRAVPYLIAGDPARFASEVGQAAKPVQKEKPVSKPQKPAAPNPEPEPQRGKLAELLTRWTGKNQ